MRLREFNALVDAMADDLRQRERAQRAAADESAPPGRVRRTPTFT